MSLEQDLQDNTAALIKLTEVVLQNGSCAPAATTEKKKRRTKVEIAADEAAAVIAAGGEVETTAPGLDLGVEAPPSAGSSVTLEDLKEKGHFLVACGDNQEGLAKARELIKSYGVTTLDEIKPEDYSKLNAQFIEETKNWGQKSAPNTQL